MEKLVLIQEYVKMIIMVIGTFLFLRAKEKMTYMTRHL